MFVFFCFFLVFSTWKNLVLCFNSTEFSQKRTDLILHEKHINIFFYFEFLLCTLVSALCIAEMCTLNQFNLFFRKSVSGVVQRVLTFLCTIFIRCSLVCTVSFVILFINFYFNFRINMAKLDIDRLHSYYSTNVDSIQSWLQTNRCWCW